MTMNNISPSGGLNLKCKKYLLAKESIPFQGVIITKENIPLDPSKVDALHHVGRPDNKEDVISFLCMIQSFQTLFQTYHRQHITYANVPKNTNSLNGKNIANKNLKT